MCLLCVALKRLPLKLLVPLPHLTSAQLQALLGELDWRGHEAQRAMTPVAAS